MQRSCLVKYIIANDSRMKKLLRSADVFGILLMVLAGIAQLVERNLAKVEVAGPSPVSRSVSRMHSNQRHS
jgi:hypothetical protein